MLGIGATFVSSAVPPEMLTIATKLVTFSPDLFRSPGAERRRKVAAAAQWTPMRPVRTHNWSAPPPSCDSVLRNAVQTASRATFPRHLGPQAQKKRGILTASPPPDAAEAAPAAAAASAAAAGCSELIAMSLDRGHTKVMTWQRNAVCQL